MVNILMTKYQPFSIDTQQEPKKYFIGGASSITYIKVELP